MSHERGSSEVQRILDVVLAWADRRDDIRALLLVGSHARGTATPGSDVDLVVLTRTPRRYIDREDWVGAVGGASVAEPKTWGAITERRVRMPTGLEVEFGFGTPSWASGEPLDAGTRRVLQNGFEVVLDRDGALALLHADLDEPVS